MFWGVFFLKSTDHNRDGHRLVNFGYLYKTKNMLFLNVNNEFNLQHIFIK